MKYRLTTNLYLNDILKTKFITLTCMLIFISMQGQTIIFDNLITNKYDFENYWEIPIQESWYNRFF